jgi:Caspase domain
MTKKAILIGINYSGDNQLYGCINDVIQMKSILIDIYGFQDGDILTLRDDDPTNMPTKRRILSELVNIVQSAPEFIYIHYSGHGTNITDTNKDEKDGRDECIVPSDHSESGIISDDELNMTLVGIKSTGIAVFDCCRSGTILDLPFELINAANAVTTSGGLYCFSGCLDNQLATETFADVPGLPQGAMTAAFISVLRKLKYYPAIGELYSALKGDLKINGFEQIPYITSTVEITPTTPFPYVMQSNTVNVLVVPESGQVPISANLQVIPDISSNLVVPESIQVPISVIEKTNTVYTTMLETNIRSLNSQISTMNSQNVKLNSEIASFIKNMHIIALKNNKLEAYVRALVKQIPGMYIVEAGSTGPTGPQVSVELPVPQVPVELPVELPVPVSQVPIELPVPVPVDPQVPTL